MFRVLDWSHLASSHVSHLTASTPHPPHHPTPPLVHLTPVHPLSIPFPISYSRAYPFIVVLSIAPAAGRLASARPTLVSLSSSSYLPAPSPRSHVPSASRPRMLSLSRLAFGLSSSRIRLVVVGGLGGSSLIVSYTVYNVLRCADIQAGIHFMHLMPRLGVEGSRHGCRTYVFQVPPRPLALDSTALAVRKQLTYVIAALPLFSIS